MGVSTTGSVSIEPANGLRPGQRVEVTVTGFPAEAKVWLSECAQRSDANPTGCGDQLAAQPFLVTDTQGNATGPFSVRTFAAAGALRLPTVTCRYTCVLTATTGDTPDPMVKVAALRYAAPRSAVGIARLRVLPASGLHGGEEVTLNLNRFLPGEKVFFSECAPRQHATERAGCGDQAATELFTVTNDAGSEHGARFRVTNTVHGHACRPSCEIAAIGDDELATAQIRFQ